MLQEFVGYYLTPCVNKKMVLQNMNKLQFQWNVIIFSLLVLMAHSPETTNSLGGKVLPRPQPGTGWGNEPVPCIVFIPSLGWIVPLGKLWYLCPVFLLNLKNCFLKKNHREILWRHILKAFKLCFWPFSFCICFLHCKYVIYFERKKIPISSFYDYIKRLMSQQHHKLPVH